MGLLMQIRSLMTLVLLAALLPSATTADSWVPPRTTTYGSPHLSSRVTIVPRQAQAAPVATVERRQSDGWKLVWRGPLVNATAPTRALVADDASHLVTFDNWGSMGYGDDVVVIYDVGGKLVRKLSLEEILPREYVSHLPRSVSSIWWGGEHRLVDDDRYVELQVVAPGPDIGDERSYVPVRIRLADGQVVPPSGAGWDAAMAKARQLEAERMAAWNALRRMRAEPLRAPASRDTYAWHRYVGEVRERLSDEDEYVQGMVLAAEGRAPGYDTAQSIAREVERYDPAERYPSRHWILASPDSRALADLLAKAMLDRKPGAMRGLRIVFVGKTEDGGRVVAAGRHVDAQVTVVDVEQPLPSGKPLPELPPVFWMPPGK